MKSNKGKTDITMSNLTLFFFLIPIYLTNFALDISCRAYYDIIMILLCYYYAIIMLINFS